MYVMVNQERRTCGDSLTLPASQPIDIECHFEECFPKPTPTIRHGHIELELSNQHFDRQRTGMCLYNEVATATDVYITWDTYNRATVRCDAGKVQCKIDIKMQQQGQFGFVGWIEQRLGARMNLGLGLIRLNIGLRL